MLSDPSVEFLRAGSAIVVKLPGEKEGVRSYGISDAVSEFHARHRKGGHQESSNYDLVLKNVYLLFHSAADRDDFAKKAFKKCGLSELKSMELWEKFKHPGSGKMIGTIRDLTSYWINNKLAVSIGINVDMQFKDIFNGQETELTSVVSRVIWTFNSIGLKPLGGGVKVSNRRRLTDGGKVHPGCRVCANQSGKAALWTEVDIVGYDSVKDEVCVIELKTRMVPSVSTGLYNMYNLQLWLTTLMFSATYPHLAPKTKGYLLVVSPAAGYSKMYVGTKPALTDKLKRKFPMVRHTCPQQLKAMAPRASGIRSASVSPDTTQLCYRYNAAVSAMASAPRSNPPQRISDSGTASAE